MSHHSSQGTLYLIPSSLGEASLPSVWPADHFQLINSLDLFIVENLRTARRFLKRAGYAKDFQEVKLFPMDKHSPEEELTSVLDLLSGGSSIGLLSEAGCPGIADPGQRLVAYAHSQNFRVKPLVGPSSILLALMASGLNGQQFSFHGYLPVQARERNKRIRELESDSRKNGSTQIFMETPYRNQALAESVVAQCQENSSFCIAAELSMPGEYVRTQSIREWRCKGLPGLHKRPAIFLLLGH